MPEMTLKWVGQEAREYDTQHGRKAAIRLKLDDTDAELTTNADKVADRLTKLNALIDKPGEWLLKEQGTFSSGDPKPLKVVEWPGKPQGQYQGNGSGGGKSSAKSGDFRTPEQIVRGYALSSAVEFVSAQVAARPELGAVADDVLAVAEQFVEFVNEPAGGAPSSPSSAPPAESSEEAPPVLGKAGGADSDQGEGATASGGTPPPSPKPDPYAARETCAHEFTPAPRDGWVMCSKCGHAEKGKA